MNSYDDLIRELSDLCGIVPEYWDIFGNRHVTSQATAKSILNSMGLALDSEESIASEIAERRARPWKTFLNPVHVLSVNEQPISFPVYVPCEKDTETNLTVSWSLEDEMGQKEDFTISGETLRISEEKVLDGARYVRIDIVDSRRRDIGYYTVRVACHTSSGPPGKAARLSKN